MADLYALLGVPRDASQDQIKRAYRRRARELHPDAGGDADAFKQVTHAYEVLSDAERRARYDRFGDDATRATTADPFGFGGGGSGGLGDVFDAFFGKGFTTSSRGDVFDAFFGTGFTTSSRARTDEPGRDVLVGIELDLEEVAVGTQREVAIDMAMTCERCDGSGSAGGAGPVTCRTCGGAGQVRRVVRSAFGQMATVRACADCGGSGRTVGDPCPRCQGEGRHRERRTVTIQVPPGVEHGDRLRVSASGEAGRRRARTGDLLVEVRIRPHEVFTRDGRDLACDVSVPLVHAALGAELEVPTLTGETTTVEMPPGTQPGHVLTVRRAGLPRRGGHDPGALHVRVNVEVPRVSSPEEEELLRRFAEVRGEQVPPAGRGLFRRLREAFR